MSARTRLALAAGSGVASVLAVADPAWAHGVGSRGDLPLPVWLFAYGAGGALLVSFAALVVFWPVSRLEQGIAGAPVRPLDRVLRALAPFARLAGLVAFALVCVAAVLGEPDVSMNFAPTAIYVVFWVGFQVVSALVGDVWRVVSPFDTLAAAGAWLRRRVTGERSGARRAAPAWGHWPAVVLLLGFVWLELVYPDPGSPRALAVAIGAYTVVVLTGAAIWGRAWLRDGEAFAAWFGLLAHIAPWHRDADGRLRLRPPLIGLVGLRVIPGTTALVLVALGSTSFDGLSRTRFWTNIIGSRTGWEAVPFNTLGLLWMIGIVAVAYVTSMRVAARMVDRDADELVAWFVHSLVPIAFAYVVAHYFSLFVFEGQTAISLVSDPLGRGWDTFGTADWKTNYAVVSTATIAWVQAGGIVAGHVAGVAVAHDRALARFPSRVAARSQYPLVAAMVLYSVGGLALLMGA